MNYEENVRFDAHKNCLYPRLPIFAVRVRTLMYSLPFVMKLVEVAAC